MSSVIYLINKKCELIGCTESNRIVYFSGESPITSEESSEVRALAVYVW